jgi:tetratricopeptide (TPR) repeat protein
VLAIVGSLNSATADPLGDEPQPAGIQSARCFGVDIDFRITACSALIDSARGTPRDRAEFFISRGSAFLSRGQDELAMQDFDSAIRLDPDQANAFLHQGKGLRLGPLGPAFADFDKACTLRPKLQLCQRHGRADTYPVEEEFEAAVASAPADVQYLQCRDIPLLSGDALADFRKWFDQFMTPVSRTGISMDQIYSRLVADCTDDQERSAVDATRQLRLLLQGLTIEHPGGK